MLVKCVFTSLFCVAVFALSAQAQVQTGKMQKVQASEVANQQRGSAASNVTLNKVTRPNGRTVILLQPALPSNLEESEAVFYYNVPVRPNTNSGNAVNKQDLEFQQKRIDLRTLNLGRATRQKPE